MTINVVKKIDGAVPIHNVLISVSDKSGLDKFVPLLIAECPGIWIFSTGGTYSYLEKIIDPNSGAKLFQVSEYTGQPETQGGLVKTLDFKIYLGLLTETYNEAHQADLARNKSVPIDMVVVNLYPFKETIAKEGVTAEQARGNIDIGGPCMIRAGAKNYIRVATVVQPGWYPWIIEELRNAGGCISLETRYKLMKIAFMHTAEYDKEIAKYWFPIDWIQATSCYELA